MLQSLISSGLRPGQVSANWGCLERVPVLVWV
jgi:hypothetical protein